jgi:hypothetical protein
VRQNVDDPEQEAQVLSQVVQVVLPFVGSRKEPDGQVERHVPLERTKPGIQPVHWAWSTVEAVEKLGIWQLVHLGPQAKEKSIVSKKNQDNEY